VNSACSSTRRPVTRGQLRDIAIALHHFGLSTRDQALGYCAAVIGRPIASRKDLNTREASQVLDAIEGQLATSRRGAA
jgi:hypothetical protein